MSRPIRKSLILLSVTAMLSACGGSVANKTLRPYHEAVKADPQNTDAYYDLGAAALTMDNYKEARKALSRCIELDPGHLEAKIQLARALDNLDEYIEASRCLLEVSEADSTHIVVNEKMGKRNLNLILSFEIISGYEKPPLGSELNPSQKRLLNSTGLRLRDYLELYPDTEAIFLRLTRLEPNNPDNWCGLGAIRHQLEDFDGSVQAYRKAQDVYPDCMANSIAHSTMFQYSRMKEKCIPSIQWIFSVW